MNNEDENIQEVIFYFLKNGISSQIQTIYKILTNLINIKLQSRLLSNILQELCEKKSVLINNLDNSAICLICSTNKLIDNSNSEVKKYINYQINNQGVFVKFVYEIDFSLMIIKDQKYYLEFSKTNGSINIEILLKFICNLFTNDKKIIRSWSNEINDNFTFEFIVQINNNMFNESFENYKLFEIRMTLEIDLLTLQIYVKLQSELIYFNEFSQIYNVTRTFKEKLSIINNENVQQFIYKTLRFFFHIISESIHETLLDQNFKNNLNEIGKETTRWNSKNLNVNLLIKEFNSKT